MGTKQETKAVDLFNGYTPALPDKSELAEVFKRIADFQAHLFEKPDEKYVEKTPDGKADSLVISYIEGRLDELYSGLWNVVNFEWKQVQNEICGSLTLEVFHPECGVWIKRTGVAAIQIMMDKCPDGVDKSAWALDVMHKKPNALYMGFGKLKAECLKNAAKSLGRVFGRELNRKKFKITFTPDVYDIDSLEVREEITELLETTTLPEAEIEVMKKITSDAKTGFTRLAGIKERLLKNQKKNEN